METKTKAETFCEIAEWLKRQDKEFTQNFRSMKSIIQLWKELPAIYNKRIKIDVFIESGGQSAEELALAVNAIFGKRYFDNAEKRYKVDAGLRRWQGARYHTEVYLRIYDRYELREIGGRSIEIQSMTDASMAVEKLIKGMEEDVERWGSTKDELEISITGKDLKKCMKDSNKEGSGELKVRYSI